MSEKFRGVNPEEQREPQRVEIRGEKESVRTRPDTSDSEQSMDIRLTADQLAAMDGLRRVEARRQADELREALRSRMPHTPAAGDAVRTDRHQGLEVLLQRLDAGLAIDGGKRSLWKKASEWWSGTRGKKVENIVRDVRDEVRSYGERYPDAAQNVDGIHTVEQARAAMDAIRRHKESRRR